MLNSFVMRTEIDALTGDGVYLERDSLRNAKK